MVRRTNVYMVTYNNAERLNESVQRYLNSLDLINPSEDQVQLFIINNHSNFELKPEFLPFLGVLHNVMRPDNSCGHLSRDYNAALMHGFRSLSDPIIDQVVCMHDDSLLHHDWYSRLKKIHETYTFYAGNHGCSLTSFLPDAVKKIGIWDERFCNIGYHEADYFLRAKFWNTDKSSINDNLAGRVLNPTEQVFDTVGSNGAKNEHVATTMPYHTVSRKMFAVKWNMHPEFWDARLPPEPKKKPLIPTYMTYPYFEMDIENLKAKNYIYASPGLDNFLEEWK